MTLEAESVEALDGETQARLRADVHSALKRRPAQETRLAGVVRALTPLSVGLRADLVGALDVMVRRGSFERPLYGAVVRALAEAREAPAAELLARALVADDCGGLATLSAACFCKHPGLSEPLARAAISRHAHLAFAAEIARLSRGESNGAAFASLAPKIKESHRIALCLELMVPLLAAPPLSRGVAPALSVLRDSERHLGRWLVLAEIAGRAGDGSCQAEASERARSGPESARAAWSLVAWALSPNGESPNVRPTVELVARLSDRPSADKDPTFLFRFAAARAPSARPMLESLAKGSLLGDECGVRAMLHLCRDYGQERYRDQLGVVARAPRKDPLRALAAAALYDVGAREAALTALEELLQSRHLTARAWARLVLAREAARFDGAVVSELRFRRVQLGWVE
ncbi:MAG TPA: hypothetical protein VG937_21030 [Polyangiaceae bacterium]|nr:hypothetical protein [Polyangiaceae bacterium]